jgi:hypothetical protein
VQRDEFEAYMLEKHDLKALSDAVSEAWKSVNFTKVNGLDVRLRVVSEKLRISIPVPITTSCSAASKGRLISTSTMAVRPPCSHTS